MSKQPAGKKMPATGSKDNDGISGFPLSAPTLCFPKGDSSFSIDHGILE